MNDVLDVALAVIIARMRFAGEDELYRPVLVPREVHDVVQLLEDQRRSLVGRKAARKADRQRVGIKQVIERDEVAVRQSLALDQQPPPRKLDKLAAQLGAQRPELLVGNEVMVRQPLPELRRVDLRRPIRPRRAKTSRDGVGGAVRQLALPEPADRPLHPAQQVNAIGDVTDRKSTRLNSSHRCISYAV